MLCRYTLDAMAMTDRDPGANEPTHERRSIRLPGFDYTSYGAYFVTICAHKRRCLFANPRSPDLRLTRLGWMVVECWLAIPAHAPEVANDAFVVMPNHLHGVLLLKRAGKTAAEFDERRRRLATTSSNPRSPDFPRPEAGSLSAIIRSFKSAVTHRARRELGRSVMRVWQRGFFDRIVRNERELNDIRLYIRENPRRWARDTENPMAQTDAAVRERWKSEA